MMAQPRRIISNNEIVIEPQGQTQDIFDSIIGIEEAFVEYGREEGLKDGKRSGIEEGFELGLAKGNEIGSEVGYYWGCVQTWKSLIQLSPSSFNPRSRDNVLKLEELITNYTNSNIDPRNEELTEVLDKIRSKYKMVCSLLGIGFKNSPKLDF